MSYAKITLIGAMQYFENRQEDLFDYLSLPEGMTKQTLIDDLVFRAGDFELLHINPEFTRYAIGSWCTKWADTWQHWYDALIEEYDPLENYNRHEEYTDKHTGTQTSLLTGSDTTANTGTQTVSNTGTQTTANTGTQTNNETVNETGSKTTTTNGSQETTPTGHDTTVTTHNKYAYNENTEGTVYPESEDGTLTTPGTKVTVSTTGGTTERPLLTTTDNTTRTDNLTEQRTDNLSSQRTDALSETKTLNETDQRTDNLKTEHTAHLYGNIGVTTSQQMLQQELDVRKFNIYDKIADMFMTEFCILIY